MDNFNLFLQVREEDEVKETDISLAFPLDDTVNSNLKLQVSCYICISVPTLYIFMKDCFPFKWFRRALTFCFSRSLIS